VVHVQVRAQHDIDRVRRHTGRAQIFEKRRVHHVERLAAAPVLVVPHARVDQHRQARRPHDEGVDRLQEAALVVEEVRREPVAVPLHGRRRGVGQKPRRTGGPGALDDGGHAETTEAQRIHGRDTRGGDARGQP
jgi:hypothetical protein